jgi:hypothetical protein
MDGLRGWLVPMALAASGCASVPPVRPARTPPGAASEPVRGSSAEAAESTTAPQVSPVGRTAPGWAQIYTRYFGMGTDGDCGRSRACHAETMSDAASAYTWLTQRGYIAGLQSPLVSPTNSCLRWFGGNMPPRASANEDAIRDLAAWVAAGAPRSD